MNEWLLPEVVQRVTEVRGLETNNFDGFAMKPGMKHGGGQSILCSRGIVCSDPPRIVVGVGEHGNKVQKARHDTQDQTKETCFSGCCHTMAQSQEHQIGMLNFGRNQVLARFVGGRFRPSRGVGLSSGIFGMREVWTHDLGRRSSAKLPRRRSSGGLYEMLTVAENIGLQSWCTLRPSMKTVPDQR